MISSSKRKDHLLQTYDRFWEYKVENYSLAELKEIFTATTDSKYQNLERILFWN